MKRFELGPSKLDTVFSFTMKEIEILLVKVLLKRTEVIVGMPGVPWEKKYDLIFSPEISERAFELLSTKDYCDPDMGYEDDVQAFVRWLRRATENFIQDGKH